MAFVTKTPAGQRSTSGGGGGTPPSPTRISRIQETEQLRDLNDRLAVYTNRVRSLESENEALHIRIKQWDADETWELTKLKTLYETQLADARRSLDDSSKERAWLQLKLETSKADHEQLQQNYNRKDSEAARAQARLKDLDARLMSKDGLLATAVSEKRSLEVSLADLQEQMQELDVGLAQTKKQLRDEILLRVHLENRCQSLTQEMDIKKKVYEMEVKEARQRYETRPVEVDSRRKQEYEYKVTERLAEMRAQNEEQIRLYKDNVDSTYQTKTRGWRDRISELEEDLVQEKANSRRLLADKDREVAEIRAKMQEQLDMYAQLLDDKLALDMEINVYRKLLEGEEERLKLSPSPSSQVTTVTRFKEDAACRDLPASQLTPQSAADQEGSSL